MPWCKTCACLSNCFILLDKKANDVQAILFVDDHGRQWAFVIETMRIRLRSGGFPGIINRRQHHYTNRLIAYTHNDAEITLIDSIGSYC